MRFEISGFTDVGTVRDLNQDRILINGNLSDGDTVELSDQDSCVCFVADGVGGSRRGDFAAEFVLRRICGINSLDEMQNQLRIINEDLLKVSARRSELAGTATTLTGLIATNNRFQVIHTGDSQMWLRRGGTMFKVTNDHVLNEYESNSPITSYFGGSDADLKFDDDIFVNEIEIGDVFLICSDGLPKSLRHKTIKSILDAEAGLTTQAQRLLTECRAQGAEDNVSVILVKRTQ